MDCKLAIVTAAAPKAIGPYSQGMIAGDLIFTSGQLGLDPATGNLLGTTAAEQAEQALKNLEAVLKAAGSHLRHAVKATVYLTDLSEFGAVNEVYSRYFTPPYPARVCIQAAALPKNARVEIEVVAVRN